MDLSSKYRSHLALMSAFQAITAGYEQTDDGDRSDGMDDLLDTLKNHESHLLSGKIGDLSDMDHRIRTIQLGQSGIEPYLIYEDGKEFGVIVTCNPDALAQELDGNLLAKIGRFSPAEIELHRVHKS